MANKPSAEKTLLVISAPHFYNQLKKLLPSEKECCGLTLSNAAKLPAPNAAVPAALILDITLKNALEICHKAKSDPRLCEIPLLALLPTDSSSDIRTNALLSGADMLAEMPYASGEEIFVKLAYLL
ncbi:MAG TPA: hypothetical protein PLL10_09410, partial [Elusimicrobiales bacterium]|nr:hypothetical protein [Elusimicrobiales bacterium]